MSAEHWRRTRTVVAPRLSAWQAWRFQHLWLDLSGRCGTLETFVDARGTVVASRLSAWQAWRFRHLRFDLRGKCVALGAFGSIWCGISGHPLKAS